MYGKSFSRMYQGSMVGAGSHVFAVWGYCISNADPESHTVDLNPVLLSAVIGDSIERITTAIDYLSKPDPNSHNTEQDGRRIVHTTGFEYFLVSHEIYRNLQSSEELREYFREQKRKQRELSKNFSDSPKTPASVSVSDKISLEGDCKGETDSEKADAEWQEIKSLPGLAFPRRVWLELKQTYTKGNFKKAVADCSQAWIVGGMDKQHFLNKLKKCLSDSEIAGLPGDKKKLTMYELQKKLDVAKASKAGLSNYAHTKGHKDKAKWDSLDSEIKSLNAAITEYGKEQT